MKASKRFLALETIRLEYAKNGCSTRESLRAFIENKISKSEYDLAAKKGIDIYNGKTKLV